jgi:hypothetical protein
VANAAPIKTPFGALLLGVSGPIIEKVPMDKSINFEDNVFVLNQRIRMIRDLLLLDVDGALFLEKTLEDLDFIGRALGRLLEILGENSRHIDREGRLENLFGTERLFSRLLTEVLDGSGSVSAAKFPLIRQKAALLRDESEGRQQAIGQSGDTGERVSTEPVVSGDELSELLKDLV